MSYWTLLTICVGLYVVLNFAAIPRLKQRWTATRSLSKIGKAGLIAGLTTLRNAALIASITYTAFAIVVIVLGFVRGDATFLGWVVEKSASLHDRLSHAKKLIETWMFILPAGLVVYFAWRRMRQELRYRFDERVLDEMDRLNAERAANPAAWDAVAASPEIDVLDRQIAELSTQLSATRGPDRDSRARLAREIAVLQAKRRTLDYEARVDLSPVHDALADPPASGWRRWRSLFLSRGFFADTKGLTKLLSRAALAALTISLVSVGAHAGLTDEIARRIASVDELRVANIREHGPRSFETARSEPTAAPDSQDAEAVRHLTQQFARALTSNRQWRALRPPISLSHQAEQNLARRAILNRATLPTADGKAVSHAVENVVDLSAVERQILDDLAPSGSRPQSQLGAELADRRGRQIVRWFGSRWEQTRRAVLDHAALYRQPIGPDDLQSAIVDRILSSIADEAVPNGGGELGKQARSAFTSAAKAAINEGVEHELRTMLADLEAGRTMEEALGRVRTRPVAVAMHHADGVAALLEDSRVVSEQMARKVAPDQMQWRAPDSPGSTPSAGSASNASDIIDDIARAATRNGQVSLQEDAIEALAEYEDHFPRTAAGQSRTRFGQTMTRYLAAADRPAFERMALARATRARSFTMLRGFSRIGGVLIGTGPDTPTGSLDLRDIGWNIEKDRVALSVKTGAGASIDVGSYDRAIVHQALAYAADGRPVAVTMTTASPLSRLKIHLHPALLDTPLGCQVIELDRLVDTHAGRQLPRREELRAQYVEQERLYRFAWGSRVNGLASQAESDSPLRTAGARRVQEGLRDSNVSTALEHFTTTDGPGSIFRRKPEFFDPDLVDAMRTCAVNRGPAEFGRCIENRFAGRLSEARRNSSRWFTLPAFEPWSGVRERPFQLDRDLSFVRDRKGADPLLHPFRFMVQLAFTTPAIGAANPDDYVDEHPLEFDEVQGQIEDLVRSGVAARGQAPMFDSLRSFTLLQRLFRVLLEGQGGAAFPVGKLAGLEAATAGSVRYVHTRRWNGSESAWFGDTLHHALAQPPTPSEPSWMQSARVAGQRCVATLPAAEASTLSDAAWEQACNFQGILQPAFASCRASAGHGASCAWAQIAGMASDIPRIRRYERAFGVLEDERLERKSSCSAIVPPAR